MIGEASDRITLPIDMKKLRETRALASVPVPVSNWPPKGASPYPNVAPDAPIYCPSVLMMPLGPAPYLKMLTVPGRKSVLRCDSRWGVGARGSSRLLRIRTVDEANDDTNSYSEV